MAEPHRHTVPGARPRRQRWSLYIGSLAGIPIYVHASFLLLVLWVGFQNAEGGAAAILYGLIFLGAIFFCIVLHELGHALAARLFGIPTSSITLLPIGGLALLREMPRRPSHELVVALAGPAVNLVIASLLGTWMVLTQDLSQLGDLPQGGAQLVRDVLLVNLFLVAFNMLPAFPMDGGRVLRALLALFLPYPRATRYAALVGKGMALLFAVAALWPGFGSPMLLLIAAFVWLGAGQEARMVEMQTLLSGISVAEAMHTRFLTLSPDEPLGQAARWAMSGGQQDFPVVEGGRVLGLLTSGDLMGGLAARGEDSPVSLSMRTDFPVADAAEPLMSVLRQMQSAGCGSLPVQSQGTLVGLLTREGAHAYLGMRSAMGQVGDGSQVGDGPDRRG